MKAIKLIEKAIVSPVAKFYDWLFEDESSTFIYVVMGLVAILISIQFGRIFFI